MKKTDFLKEIKALPVEDLNKKVEELELELSNLTFQGATEQIQNPIRKRDIRREIARIKTVISAKA